MGAQDMFFKTTTDKELLGGGAEKKDTEQEGTWCSHRDPNKLQLLKPFSRFLCKVCMPTPDLSTCGWGCGTWAPP